MAEKQTGRHSNWTSLQAYLLAAVCLMVGIAMGYFFRGSGAQASSGSASANAPSNPPPGMPPGMGQQRVTQEQLKQMADKKAEPLLFQLQSSPNDPALLRQIGNIYYDTQNYGEAIKFYDQSLKADPKNPDLRTDLGTSYYYLGNADRALQEFRGALKYDPKHAQTMFNMGMVQWQGKDDAKAAVASWEQLLKAVPDYPDRTKVEQLIEKAKAHANMAPGTKTNKPATM
jgi:cytochrome c-type biogenesis protein CcmH/NrfG